MNPQTTATVTPNLSASQSQFAFQVNGLAEDSFAVKSFVGKNHALDQDYLFEVALLSAGIIMPEQMVGQRAVLHFLTTAGGVPVSFPGVVCKFTWAGESPSGREYVASLASPLYPLKLRTNQRIFLNRSVPQIIEEVLGQADLGAEVEMNLRSSYLQREFTVQYAESDWDFVTRLAAGCGIFFRLDSDQELSRINFHDSIEELPSLPGETPMSYQPQTGAVRGRETIFSFNTRTEVLPGGVELWDYNDQTPETPLEASASQTVNVPGHGRTFLYGENQPDLEQTSQLAKLRLQQHEWQRRRYFAETDCRSAAPGMQLAMSGHPVSTLNGEYLIVSVAHQGTQEGGFAYSGMNLGMSYRNRLVLIPIEIPYRSRIPVQPRNHSIFTARIETTGGSYPYLDEQGRYRVRFDFDAGEAAQGQASRAARLLQSCTGETCGSHTPLHAGTEVALTCVNGDLDRPVILGVLSNPQIPSPVTSANCSQNILRTFGGNELLLEDRQGQERIELFTSERKNLLQLDANETGHRVSLISREGGMELSAAKTLLTESGDTQSTVAGDNQLIFVENSQRLMTRNREIKLQAATDIRFKAADKVNLKAEKKDIRLHADKDLVINTAEGMSVEVRNQNLSLRVENGELSIAAAREINIVGQGSGAITIGQSGGQIQVAPNGNITISSHTVNINGQSVAMGGMQNSQGGGREENHPGQGDEEIFASGFLNALDGAERSFFKSTKNSESIDEI